MHVIVDNLTDPRMTEIDARNFSMEMYYEARDITWCLNYNEQLRMRKSDSEKLDLYSEDLYQAVKANILNCGILGGMASPKGFVRFGIFRGIFSPGFGDSWPT